MLMGKKYSALVPRNSCFGRPREARSRTIGGPASPVDVESAPLAEPATSVPQRVSAPGSVASRTSSRAGKTTIAPTPRRKETGLITPRISTPAMIPKSAGITSANARRRRASFHESHTTAALMKIKK